MEYLASQFGQHESYVNGQNILKLMLEKYLLRYYDTRVQDPEISLLSATSSGNTTTISAASSASENNHNKNERKHSFMSWNDDDLQCKMKFY
jgi:hypothetical protein